MLLLKNKVSLFSEIKHYFRHYKKSLNLAGIKTDWVYLTYLMKSLQVYGGEVKKYDKEKSVYSSILSLSTSLFLDWKWEEKNICDLLISGVLSHGRPRGL